jgi:hypothetical protein
MPEKVSSAEHEHLPTKLGTEFIMAFYRLLKGTTLYNRNNIIIDRFTQESLQVTNNIMRSEGRLFLKIVRNNLFFNNQKIHVKADYYSLLRGFLQEMRNRWIGEVEFTEEVNGEQLKDFIFLLSGLEEKNEINYLYVNRQLEYRGIDAISVGKLELFRDEEIYVDSKGRKRFSEEVYFKSIGLVKEVVESVRNQKVLNVRKAKRLMQNAVNAIMQDESVLLGLANIDRKSVV